MLYFFSTEIRSKIFVPGRDCRQLSKAISQENFPNILPNDVVSHSYLENEKWILHPDKIDKPLNPKQVKCNKDEYNDYQCETEPVAKLQLNDEISFGYLSKSVFSNMKVRIRYASKSITSFISRILFQINYTNNIFIRYKNVFNTILFFVLFSFFIRFSAQVKKFEVILDF